MLQLRSPPATTKTWGNQINLNKSINIKEKKGYFKIFEIQMHFMMNGISALYHTLIGNNWQHFIFLNNV